MNPRHVPRSPALFKTTTLNPAAASPSPSGASPSGTSEQSQTGQENPLRPTFSNKRSSRTGRPLRTQRSKDLERANKDILPPDPGRRRVPLQGSSSSARCGQAEARPDELREGGRPSAAAAGGGSLGEGLGFLSRGRGAGDVDESAPLVEGLGLRLCQVGKVGRHAVEGRESGSEVEADGAVFGQVIPRRGVEDVEGEMAQVVHVVVELGSVSAKDSVGHFVCLKAVGFCGVYLLILPAWIF